MNNGNSPPAASSREKSPTKLYIAAAIGAFFLGFGDLLNNESAATVLKISEVIRQYLYPELVSGGLIALILLVLLGGCVCWVHQPHTRVDAFTRGFSVFAILAVITPYNTPPGGLDSIIPQTNNVNSWLSVFPTAWAEELDLTKTPHAGKKDNQSGKVRIMILSTSEDKKATRYTTVTVRNPNTAEIIAVERVYGNVFTLQKPVGVYLLEIESPGYKRIRTDVKIIAEVKEYSLPIENTMVPLSILRLFSPKVVELTAEPKVVELKAEEESSNTSFEPTQ